MSPFSFLGSRTSMQHKIHPTSKIIIIQVGGECRVLKKCTRGGEIGEICDKCVCVGRKDQWTRDKLHTSEVCVCVCVCMCEGGGRGDG